MFQDKIIVALDEAQKVNDIGSVLKLIYDEMPEYKIIASGSSSFDLANQIGEPLTGRNIKFRLYPLSIQEISMTHRWPWLIRNLNEILVFGTYPELVDLSVADKTTKLFELSGDYLYKDILIYNGIKNPSILRKLLKSLALQVGSQVSLNELSKMLQISRPVVERYLDLLEKSFVIFSLNSLSANLRNEIKKSRKYYFYDNGILNALTGNFAVLTNRSDVDALWENFCISERIKYNHYNSRFVNLYFWRTYDGAEIDLVEERNGNYAAFEFKWKLKRNKSMHMARLLLVVLIFVPALIKAQDYPQDYFRSPVDLKLVLSGTFAELRTNHFHSGIDIKTNGSKGTPVYAIADGYVMRIKVSPSGFGKALYIDHENGYTSVYAHLSRFAPELDSFVRAKQYEKESFAINLLPEGKQFHYEKDDVIAFSGNSGSSSGPHLHFEIRERDTQIPLNPLLFGFKVRDFIRPRIKALKVYPFDEHAYVDGANKAKEFKIAGWGPKYRLNHNDTIDVSGRISFGIQTFDLLNKGLNPSGNFSIELYIDSVLCYSHYARKFPFNESRYINALIDYPVYAEQKRRLQKTHILPNNRLSIYEDVKDDGVFTFDKDSLYQLTYLIKDINGNTSRLRFTIRSHEPKANNIKKLHKKPNTRPGFEYDKENVFDNEWVSLNLPEFSLYRDIFFDYDSIGVIDDAIVPLFSIHTSFEPLHRYVKLALKVPDSIPDSLNTKLLVVRLEEDEFIAEGGEWNDGFVSTWVRDFGNYTLLIDTVPPSIKPLNIHDGKTLKRQKSMQFRIMDELAGIAEYRGTLNNQWILMEYDPKNELLTYIIDDHLKKGKNRLKVRITDERGNRQLYEATINYR